MLKEIEGYRRTAVKTKDKTKLAEKLEEFHARGETTKVVEVGGYSIVYMKIEKPEGGWEKA
jgi:hypothetical protein